MSDETTDEMEACVAEVRSVVNSAKCGALLDHERRTLLDALDAVPRSASWQHVDCEECGGTCGNAAAHYEERWAVAIARAEQAERERDREAILIASLLREEAARPAPASTPYWDGYDDALRHWAGVIEDSANEQRAARGAKQ